MRMTSRPSSPQALSTDPASLANTIFIAWNTLHRYFTDSATRHEVRTIAPGKPAYICSSAT